MQKKSIHPWELITLLSMLSALSALSIDMMLPALPTISSFFQTSDINQQQWIISIYMFGFAIAQLFYGPLSDKIGRKPTLFIGFSFYLTACIGAVLATHFEFFLMMRFLQGVGAAAARIMVNAITRDKFEGEEMAKITSLVMMVFITVPAIAPSLGSLVVLFFHWHTIFIIFIVFATVIAAWVFARLPETLNPENRQTIHLNILLANFKETITNKISVGYALISGLSFATFMAYLNASEQIFSSYYGVPKLFPFIFGALALCFGIAGFLNSLIVKRLGVNRITKTAIICSAISGVIMFILALLCDGLPPILLFCLLLGTCMVCTAFIFGNVIAIAMQPLGHIAGMAASVIGAISTGAAATTGIIISQQLDNNITPLGLGFAITGIISYNLVGYLQKSKHQSKTPKN